GVARKASSSRASSASSSPYRCSSIRAWKRSRSDIESTRGQLLANGGGSGEDFTQLLEGGPHLRLDGPDRGLAEVGDLLVGEPAVLPQQKHFLLVGAEVEQGCPQAGQVLLFLELVG